MAEAPVGSTVLYADQSDGGLYPAVSAQWGPQGQQPKVRTRGCNQKVYLFGALDAHSGQLYAGFGPHKDSRAFVDFLHALLAASPQGLIYLIVDNHGAHKSPPTRQFLTQEKGRIQLVFLPTYSPWLNRIEDTWRISKAQAGTNTWPDTIAQLTADYQATLTAMHTHILNPTSRFLSGREMT